MIPESEPFPLMGWMFPSLSIAAITGVTVERQKRMFDNPVKSKSSRTPRRRQDPAVS